VTGPVVLVTRDQYGNQTKIEWFEDENRFYDADPLAALTFDAAVSVWWGKSFRPTGSTLGLLIAVTLQMLTEDPWADVSFLATHTISEPGAPLEPIPGRSAA
jgi:hypothetical protein